jgi:hypothetical protein
VTADGHVIEAERLLEVGDDWALDRAAIHATLAVAQAAIAANRLRPGPTADRGPR